jgi:hypothetical protein
VRPHAFLREPDQLAILEDLQVCLNRLQRDVFTGFREFARGDIEARVLTVHLAYGRPAGEQVLAEDNAVLPPVQPGGIGALCAHIGRFRAFPAACSVHVQSREKAAASLRHVVRRRAPQCIGRQYAGMCLYCYLDCLPEGFPLRRAGSHPCERGGQKDTERRVSPRPGPFSAAALLFFCHSSSS